MTDQQRNEWLAEFMEFPGFADGCIIWFDNQTTPGEPHENHTPWNPLESWDDWRQVEEKMMEDGKLWAAFLKNKVWGRSAVITPCYMMADLPIRARALYLASHS